MSESAAAGSPAAVLRPTRPQDLDAVLAIEHHPDNAPWIGQWSREEHAACLDTPGREHFVVCAGVDGPPSGYLIAYDLTAHDFGVWIQRIAVSEKSRGVGRRVLRRYLDDAMRRFGTDVATLDVMPSNARAQRAYAAVGFERVDLSAERLARLAELAGGLDDDAVIMQLHARPGDTQS